MSVVDQKGWLAGPIVRVVLPYVAFGALYIFASDYLVGALAKVMGDAQWIESAKGGIFILLSAGWLALLFGRDIMSWYLSLTG